MMILIYCTASEGDPDISRDVYPTDIDDSDSPAQCSNQLRGGTTVCTQSGSHETSSTV